MSTVNEIKIVQQAKIAADEAGNNNKKLDTAEEISLFTEKLEAKGISNAKSLISGYNTNPDYYESLFERKGLSSENSTDAAIIGALNKKSYANKAEQIKEEADDIYKGIIDGIGDTWFFGLFNDYDKLTQKVGAINSDNVLAVLNKDNKLISKIVGYANQDYLDTYGNTIIGALVEKAEEKGIDVSDIVEKDGQGFITSNGVSGVKVAESATDKKNIEKVVKALKDRIEGTIDLVTDADKANNDRSETFEKLLTLNDKNKNGYLDGDEIVAFKAWCAKLGIAVNEMFNDMEGKTELSDDEKALKALFDAENPIGKTRKQEQTQNNLVAKINKSLSNKNHAELTELFQSLNKDNIEEILSSVAGGSNIGTNIANKFGEDGRSLNATIIDALMAKAKEYDIDVRNIVRKDDRNQYTVGTKVGSLGEDALDKKYVNKVIQQLRKAIKEAITED